MAPCRGTPSMTIPYTLRSPAAGTAYRLAETPVWRDWAPPATAARPHRAGLWRESPRQCELHAGDDPAGVPGRAKAIISSSRTHPRSRSPDANRRAYQKSTCTADKDCGKPATRPQPDDLFSSIDFLRVVLLCCADRGSPQSTCGQAISAVQPGPSEILRRKLCNLMIAATILKPRPRPLMFRLLSER